MKVLPGVKIPADGLVGFGASEVDESALMGESVPVPKKQSGQVVVATLNHANTIRLRLSDVGEKSAKAQITKFLKKRSLRKCPCTISPTDSFTFCAVCSLAWRHVQWFGADPRRSLTSINVSLTFYLRCCFSLCIGACGSYSHDVWYWCWCPPQSAYQGKTGGRSLGEHRCLRQEWNSHKRSPQCHRS